MRQPEISSNDPQYNYKINMQSIMMQQTDPTKDYNNLCLNTIMAACHAEVMTV